MLSWLGAVMKTYRFISCSAFAEAMMTKRAEKSINDMFQKAATAIDSKETPLRLAANQPTGHGQVTGYCQFQPNIVGAVR